MTSPTEKNPAAIETAGLEIAIQRQPLTGDAQEIAKITTTVVAVEKAAPIPAEDAARILIAALREYGQEDNRAGEAENMGRHAAVRGMMVRLGLYPEFCKALDADATEDEVAALLADQVSQEERIREDERDRIYERVERHAAGKMPDANAAAAWLTREENVMLPADRARLRGDAS